MIHLCLQIMWMSSPELGAQRLSHLSPDSNDSVSQAGWQIFTFHFIWDLGNWNCWHWKVRRLFICSELKTHWKLISSSWINQSDTDIIAFNMYDKTFPDNFSLSVFIISNSISNLETDFWYNLLSLFICSKMKVSVWKRKSFSCL